MPFDSTSSSGNSVSIPVTPSDVGASLNVAPTSTKQKKKVSIVTAYEPRFPVLRNILAFKSLQISALVQ